MQKLNGFPTRLARYQRRMSRKVKGGCNWKKAKRKVQRAHLTITNDRQDFIHKVSRQIAENHAMAVVKN